MITGKKHFIAASLIQFCFQTLSAPSSSSFSKQKDNAVSSAAASTSFNTTSRL